MRTMLGIVLLMIDRFAVAVELLFQAGTFCFGHVSSGNMRPSRIETDHYLSLTQSASLRRCQRTVCHTFANPHLLITDPAMDRGMSSLRVRRYGNHSQHRNRS